MYMADSLTVLFTTRSAVIAADVIVLLVTWQKTFGIIRQSKQLKERMPLSEVLLRDGEMVSIFTRNTEDLNILLCARNRVLRVSTSHARSDLQS